MGNHTKEVVKLFKASVQKGNIQIVSREDKSMVGLSNIFKMVSVQVI